MKVLQSALWRACLIFSGMAGAGAASADSLAILSGAGQSGPGGSAATQPIRVQVRDAGGVVVAGRSIQWTTSNNFTLGAPSSVTDAGGVASMSFVYGDYGSTAIVATDVAGDTQAQALVTSTGSDSLTLVSGNAQSGQSGSTSTQPIVVELRNAAGTPISGRAITWSDQSAYTQVSAASSLTDANGRASMGFSYLQGPAAAGGVTATIRAGNSSGAQTVDATATVLGFNTLRLVSAASQSGLIGAPGSTITVQLFDGTGVTPIAGASISWSEQPAAGFVALSAPSSVTDASGLATMNFQYVQPGSGDIRASNGGAQVDVHFVSVGSDRMTLVSPFGVTGLANSASTSPIVVEMRDVNNQPIVGRTIQWTAQNDGNATVNAPTSVTNGSGQASMHFNFGSAPRTTITALDPLTVNANPSGPNYAQTVDIFVRAIPNGTCCATMTLISGSGQTGVAGTAAAQPIVVEARDYLGAPAPGRTIAWSLDGSAVLDAATSLTDVNGRASMGFTYGSPGQTLIQAFDSHTSETPPHGNYVQAYIASTGTDTVTLFAGDQQSGLPGAASAQPLVAEFRDAGNQPIVGRSISWAVSSGSATLDAVSSVTDGSGRATMGFTYGPSASVNVIEVRDASTGVHASFRATGVGSNSISQISGNGQSGSPGSTSGQPLVVEVRDVAGAVVVGRSINWSTVAGDASATAASTVTDSAGRASNTFQYGASTSTIAAQDAVSGQEVRFTMTSIVPGNSATVVTGNGQTGMPGTSGAQPIVIELRDASNAPLPGRAIAWSVVSGPAVLGVVQNSTDAAGQASATFDFGATAGSSIIQAQDIASGLLMQASVTAIGGSQSLSKVDGDGQALVANLASAPLVVRLVSVGNVPVVGATVDWTTDNGSLSADSSVTDNNGEASTQVTPATSGAVNVQANSALAEEAVTFALGTGIAGLPNLTPEQAAVAKAIDQACPALAAQSNRSPEEADFLARCSDITASAAFDAGATASALGQLVSHTAQVQSAAAVVAAAAQFQNIKLRQTALRSSSKTSSLSNLTLTGPGGVISLGSLMNALAGDELPPVEQPIYSRWGFFAAGNIGRGEADAGRSTPAYDYDIDGLTAGIDYRASDDFLIGAALGYTRQDTDLAGNQGTVEMTGTSLSAYGTYSIKEVWYLDGVITYGWNSYEMTRRIGYTLPTANGGTTSVNQIASGDPGGDLLSGALTFGGDFHKDAFSFSPYGQMLYTRVGFDSYEETLLSGTGSGLGLAVDARDVTALTGVLGSRFAYTASTDWGVLVPTASIEWNHEFKDDENAISAHFIHDPTRTTINVDGDPMDRQYMRLGAGLSAVFPHGRSGFLLYEHMIGRDGQSQENFAIGIRVEF